MSEVIIVAIIVNFLGLIGLMVKCFFDYKAKKAGNNPHPCTDHGDKLKELDSKLDKVVQEQVRQGQYLVDCERRMIRVEGKLNGAYGKR